MQLPSMTDHNAHFASALLFMGLFFGFLTPESQALEVLFDNLAEPQNGNVNITNSNWIAQSFTTTASGFILSEVSLRLWNNSGTTGPFEIQILDATGVNGSPGAQVGGTPSFVDPADLLSTTSGGLVDAATLRNVTLAAMTNYYVLVRGVALTDVVDSFGDPRPGYIALDCSGTNTSSVYETTDSGSSWSGPFTNFNAYMKVTAVPEPSTLVMAGLCVLTLSLVARKRISETAA